jgi:hypothetical protein
LAFLVRWRSAARTEQNNYPLKSIGIGPQTQLFGQINTLAANFSCLATANHAKVDVGYPRPK